jgi:alanyl-tRNA synthetase
MSKRPVTAPKTANELRRAYLDFFVSKAHTEVASASLIPHDPTVLFSVAGMVPFKSYFTGDEVAPYSRAVTSQKCARAGGKHNDLDDVGRTMRHLVFFEMLGNFSFGDYFKADAIPYAWEFLTEWLAFDPDTLWVSVHDSDDEAEQIWHEVAGIPMNRIQRIGDKDNFWQMGDTGPCGPCSEIFFDKGPSFGPDGGPANPDAEHRFLEIWNLVFMQYNQSTSPGDSPGSPRYVRERLPKPSIDTGMGLERTLTVLNNVDAVWDTDLMIPLIEKASSLTGRTYTKSYESADDLSMRILAEHARSGAMLVGDGVFPSNEGRGYVLRRILRRAIRHAYRLGTEKNIMGQMVDVAIGVMGEAYPDVVEKRERILDIVEREEFKFRQTLKTGNSMLEDEFDNLKKGESLNGAIAFKLHDTYGFPLELTKEIAEERGLGLDQAGFDAAMANQVSMAQAARKNSKTPEALSDQYRAVMEANGTTSFIGYTETEANDATILAVVDADENGIVEIFLDRTPFYAESGGQVGDTGTITTSDGEAVVEDTTYAIPGLVRHSARIVSGAIEPNTKARAHINVEKRDATRKNHTATHLLHHALREVLGDHVKQQGSLVGPDRLRFDFFHFDPLTSAQTSQIEDIVNGIVLTGKAALNEEKTKAEAEAMGAIAFFGDKYGDRVRILLAGPSLEFCGGTHVRNVGEIGAVKIVSEGSIGSNVRRIEATTGMQTITKLRHDEALLDAAASTLRVKPEELPSRVEKMVEERKDLERQIADLKRASAGSRAAEFVAKAINGFVIARVDDLDRDGLKDLAVAIRDHPGIKAAILGSAPAAGGVNLVAVANTSMGFSAASLIADAAKMVGGGGGKGADIAIAGGKRPEMLDEALGFMRMNAER